MDDQIYFVIYRCNFTRANLFCTSVSQLVYLQGQFVHSSVNKSATRPSNKINVMEKSIWGTRQTVASIAYLAKYAPGFVAFCSFVIPLSDLCELIWFIYQYPSGFHCCHWRNVCSTAGEVFWSLCVQFTLSKLKQNTINRKLCVHFLRHIPSPVGRCNVGLWLKFIKKSFTEGVQLIYTLNGYDLL